MIPRKLCVAILLALFLGGCSVVRMSYEQAQTIAYWWLDGYFDFTAAQEAEVKHDLRELHHWHRTIQLPAYAGLLAGIAAKTSADITPASACVNIEEVRARVADLAFRSVPYLARLARQLSPAQMQHLREKLAEENESWREKWIEPTADELARARLDDWAERADSFYGDITDGQEAFMKDAIARSAFDPRLAWEQRLLRQQDLLATLDRIGGGGMAQHAAEAEVRAMLERAFDPPDPSVRAMYGRLVAEACANLAGLHQLTTQRQRLRARAKLEGYERDFRALIGN